MRKISIIAALSVIFAICVAASFGCKKPEAEITGITFSDVSYTYDGTEKSVVISGELPNGATVQYQGNKGTDAGKYDATATLSGKGFKTLVLNASLVIAKAEITGLSLSDSEQTADGQFHTPVITGSLPKGAEVKFFFDGNNADGVKAIGKYSVRAEISGKNFNTLTLECNFSLKADLSALAATVISAFGNVPNVWAFLPQGFSVENKIFAAAPDYTNFVSSSALPKNGTGKQMNVVYGVLNKATVALGYVNTVYASLNTVKTLYQTFLNNNPDDYSRFSDNTGKFTFELVLDKDGYSLTAAIGSVNVNLYAETTSKKYGARIQLAANTVLKYEVGQDSLSIAAVLAGVSATEVKFVRDGDNTLGYLYEYLVAGGKQISATSALISVGDKYTEIIGNKGDFVPTSDGRNCEVYDNLSGALVGSKVRETVEIKGVKATFNTIWLNLYDVNGIQTIKKVDEENGLNADTIYINSSANPIKTKLIGLSGGTKALSRRFDIEFKTIYYFEKNSESGEYEYNSAEIPMLFIQAENLGSFESDFSDVNSACLSGSVSLKTSDQAFVAIDYAYNTLLGVYDEVKDSVTYDSIVQSCQ